MGHFALYVLWAQSLWVPAVTPIPPNNPRQQTESITVHLFHFIPLHYIYIILYFIRIQLCILLYIIYIYLYTLHFLNSTYFRPHYTIFCFSISFYCLNYTWLPSFYSAFFLINLRSMLHHDINISYLIVFHLVVLNYILAVLCLTLLIRPLFCFILLNFIFPLFYLIILYCLSFDSFKLFHSILLYLVPLNSTVVYLHCIYYFV